ncbi:MULTISPECIES: hypothetical protein [Acinetobacter]|jgi:hypothetical protein|uniref:hypothetical protein n=1 Tax=Acinetobacter TaxID=469 RepID=UPI0015DBA5A4|nr:MULTISPECIES: hypothetical protein [Acinetobacter]MDR0238158.1 hypothetical protein [Acinetobacter sp.]
MNSVEAILKFKQLNNLNPERISTLPPFECIVSYTSKIGNPTTVASVRLVMDHMDSGNIEIDETNDIPLKKYHLSFNPHFQKYHFNSDDNSLTISGKSDKMKGRYKVNIKPL